MTRTFAFVLACVLLGASSTPSPPPRGVISIVINSVRLPVQPPPLVAGGHLFVPVRRTIEALGLQFNRQGKTISTQVGAKTVSLEIGSRDARIDGNVVELDAAPLEIKNVLYAPLRFFTDALGAQATYDRKTQTVSIDAELVGRVGLGMTTKGNQIVRFGTVSAVDVDSDPPTLTLSYNAAVKTVPIARNALIEMHDVNANVVTPGELAEVRPGDFARVYMEKNGHVTRIEDAFGSYNGRVAAAAGNEFVLSDGHVISPSRTTEVSVNGRAASIGDVRVGDQATVRYNVETNEIRSILLSRTLAPSSPQPGAPAITNVALNVDHPVKAGTTIGVTVNGTAGGAATFDIGPYVSNVAMSEQSPGFYTGSYALARSANFNDVPIIAHLRVGGTDAPVVQARRTLSVSSAPPGIADIAPSAGARVNTNRPAIYATFATEAVPVNPSSIILRVNGRDVTSESVRTERYVQYRPSYTYPSGPVRVSVRVADRAGNATTKRWTFVIHR